MLCYTSFKGFMYIKNKSIKKCRYKNLSDSMSNDGYVVFFIIFCDITHLKDRQFLNLPPKSNLPGGTKITLKG